MTNLEHMREGALLKLWTSGPKKRLEESKSKQRRASNDKFRTYKRGSTPEAMDKWT